MSEQPHPPEKPAAAPVLPEEEHDPLDIVIARSIGATVRWDNHIQRAQHVKRCIARYWQTGEMPPKPKMRERANV
jgi:hypothetical protein